MISEKTKCHLSVAPAQKIRHLTGMKSYRCARCSSLRVGINPAHIEAAIRSYNSHLPNSLIPGI